MTDMRMSEDLDPIETALSWLAFTMTNEGRLSEHDFTYVRNKVIPDAIQQKTDMEQKIKNLQENVASLEREVTF